MKSNTRVEITNVNGEINNKYVGQKGIVIQSLVYPNVDDYMIEVVLDNYHTKMLFRLSELKIIREE